MSLRSKLRNELNGVEYRRRGTAQIPTVYIPNSAKPKRPKAEPFVGPFSIALAWGDGAPDGEMTIMRIRWLRWEHRKNLQRKAAAA